MYYCIVIALFDPWYLVSQVENIHQVVNKKIASYTNYTGLIRHQHKFYYWDSQGFVKRGSKGARG